MNMLTAEDLKAIGQVVEEKLDEKLDDPEGILNIKLDAMQEQIAGVETRLTGVERQLTKTDGKVNTLVNIMEKKRVITEEEKQAVFL